MIVTVSIDLWGEETFVVFSSMSLPGALDSVSKKLTVRAWPFGVKERKPLFQPSRTESMDKRENHRV